MAVYAAQIDRMDQGLGRVLAQIRAMGEEDNTLVLFMADNGGCAELIEPNFRNLDGKVKTTGGKSVRYGNVPSIAPGPADTFQSYGIGWANASNTPFRVYKSFVHEGGIATPIIAHWPGGLGTQGRVTHEVAHLIDVMPTALEAAGAKYPADGKLTPLEGRSLLPACRGKKQQPRTLFWEHIGSRAVRHGDWKLVSAKEGPWELYHLADDRTELRNQAASEPQRVAELNRRYEDWAARCGVLPLKELRGSGTKD